MKVLYEDSNDLNRYDLRLDGTNESLIEQKLLDLKEMARLLHKDYKDSLTDVERFPFKDNTAAHRWVAGGIQGFLQELDEMSKTIEETKKMVNEWYEPYVKYELFPQENK